MLRITADVNGRAVDRLFVHNTSKVDRHGRYLYDAALWDADSGSGWFGIEEVPHYRNEPWWELVCAVARTVKREATR